jgi:NAD(P)-dependent dehydrogenase (short-subunit alcohol dehydrogenase family)
MAGMEGKLCVITGATSGIGLITAERLAALETRLVLVGRDPGRGETALARIKARAPRAEVSLHHADLSRLDGLRALAADLNARPRIDVLINNAGAMFWRRQVTADGLERTFALNHMAYFVLAALLHDKLVASSPARIVNVASEAHRGARLDFTDLQNARHYSGMRACSRSKLCNILFTRELARRLTGTGVTANCLHPGFVNSRFGDNNPGLVGLGTRIAKQLFAISPERGAETSVYLASSPHVQGKTGGYYDQCRAKSPSPEAQDDTAARRLWEESARIAGLAA